MPKTEQRFLYGLLLAAIILFLEFLVFYSTGGRLARAHWVVLYVGVAVFTGVVFWLVTPGSTGSLKFAALGIKLGGGAAIGAAFMLLAWKLSAPTSSSIVVPVPSEIPSDFTIKNLSPTDLSDLGEVRTLGGR